MIVFFPMNFLAIADLQRHNGANCHTADEPGEGVNELAHRDERSTERPMAARQTYSRNCTSTTWYSALPSFRTRWVSGFAALAANETLAGLIASGCPQGCPSS